MKIKMVWKSVEEGTENFPQMTPLFYPEHVPAKKRERKGKEKEGQDT